MRCLPLQTIVIGAGGHGAEVAAYMSDLARAGWLGTFVGFLDDQESVERIIGGQVLGKIDNFVLRDAVPFGPVGYMIAVGHNGVRKQLVARTERRFGDELTPWTLVHPNAYVGDHVDIGEGTLLAPAALATTRVSL